MVTATTVTDIRATLEAFPATTEATTTSVVVTEWVDFHIKVLTVAEHGQSAVPTVADHSPEVDRMAAAAFRCTLDAKASGTHLSTTRKF